MPLRLICLLLSILSIVKVYSLHLDSQTRHRHLRNAYVYQPNHFQQSNQGSESDQPNSDLKPDANSTTNPSTISKEEIVRGLKQKVQEFEGLISQFQTYALNAENSINQKTEISERIKLYEDLIIHERDELYLMSAKINIPLQNSAWVCEAIPDDKKSELIKQSNSLRSKIKILNSTIMGYQNVTEQKSLGQQIKLANEYNEQFMLDLSVNSDSSLIVISEEPVSVRYRTNLIDSKWVLGNQSLAQLNDKYTFAPQDRMYSVTCPTQKPYAASGGSEPCITCPLNSPYFDLKSNFCTPCAQIDLKDHTCLDKPQYNNSNLEFVKNRLLLPEFSQLSNFFSPSDVPCPSDTPFFDGNQCITCIDYFDISKKVCQSCQSNEFYNTDKFRCEKKSLTAINFNGNISGLILPPEESLLLYQQKQSKLEAVYKVTYCPEDHPYFNDYECITCEGELLFSISYKTCGTCPSSQFYDEESMHCFDVVFYSNTQNLNWIVQEQQPSEVINQLNASQQIKGSRQCPPEAPFYDNVNCIACLPLTYFSYDELKCKQCGNGTIFSKNLHKCKLPQEGYFQTNPSVTLNLIFDGRSKREWVYSYSNNLKTHPEISDCPFEKPYFDGVSCIACSEEKKYFNLGQLLCQACEEGKVYNPTAYECVKTTGPPQELSFKTTLDQLIVSALTES